MIVFFANLFTITIMLVVDGDFSLNLLSLSARGHTSESDVCRRQIQTYEDDPRTERIKMCIKS